MCGAASEGSTPLNAFDKCLLASGLGNANLIRISSILPPGVPRSEEISFELGDFVPTAYAEITSAIPDEIISAAVSIGIPKDETQNGVIMEYSARGHKEEVEHIVRNMAEEAILYRGQEVKEVLSYAVEHKVKRFGAAFAGVALWHNIKRTDYK